MSPTVNTDCCWCAVLPVDIFMMETLLIYFNTRARHPLVLVELITLIFIVKAKAHHNSEQSRWCCINRLPVCIICSESRTLMRFPNIKFVQGVQKKKRCTRPYEENKKGNFENTCSNVKRMVKKNASRRTCSANYYA